MLCVADIFFSSSRIAYKILYARKLFVPMAAASLSHAVKLFLELTENAMDNNYFLRNDFHLRHHSKVRTCF